MLSDKKRIAILASIFFKQIKRTEIQNIRIEL